MASSSDWILQLDGAPVPASSNPGWIAALAQGGADDFCDASPFARPASQGNAANSVTQGDGAPAEPLVHSHFAPDAQEEDPETKAYSRGYTDGFEEAKRVNEAAVATEPERFRDQRLAIRARDAAAVDALAQDLNATVQTLCAPVLRDYSLNAEALKERCREAAKRLGAGPAGLTLSLHPESRALLDEQAFEGWALVDDPALERGALRLCGEDGTVRDGPADWTRAIAEAIGG